MGLDPLSTPIKTVVRGGLGTRLSGIFHISISLYSMNAHCNLLTYHQLTPKISLCFSAYLVAMYLAKQDVSFIYSTQL